jgi:hypothetical protein
VSPVRYELDFYVSEDGILYSHRRENLELYIESCSSVYKTGYFHYP